MHRLGHRPVVRRFGPCGERARPGRPDEPDELAPGGDRHLVDGLSEKLPRSRPTTPRARKLLPSPQRASCGPAPPRCARGGGATSPTRPRPGGETPCVKPSSARRARRRCGLGATRSHVTSTGPCGAGSRHSLSLGVASYRASTASLLSAQRTPAGPGGGVIISHGTIMGAAVQGCTRHRHQTRRSFSPSEGRSAPAGVSGHPDRQGSALELLCASLSALGRRCRCSCTRSTDYIRVSARAGAWSELWLW